ncbi:MAG: hypothetical protein ABI860_11485 [Gemmatimonadales bacterium]
MMGCLTAPFKALGCLVFLAALILGWLYRDVVVREGRRLLGRIEGPASASAPGAVTAGRPGTRSLASARAKIDSLNGWRADSVVLTPSEVASLMGQGFAPEFRRELDSLRVELLHGEVKVRARINTKRLPSEVIGPFAMALQPTEPVEAVGPLRVTGPGVGEWDVRSFRIREFPIPAAAVKTLVTRALRDSSRRTVPWQVPAGIRGVRVRPTGATLYGAARP